MANKHKTRRIHHHHRHHSSTMTMKSAMAVGALVLIVVVLQGWRSEAAISCSDVIKDLRPCLSYLSSGSGKPPAACCSGAKALASAAATSQDKKAACNCIKSAAKSVSVNSQLAQALPANCGISVPIPISSNADCSKVG